MSTTPCSACVNEAGPIPIHGYDLCPEHASGMMTAVLTGDYTPVGYIIAAACGLVIDSTIVVSDRKPQPVERRSPFMRHGALPEPVEPASASPRSACPLPLRAQAF